MRVLVESEAAAIAATKIEAADLNKLRRMDGQIQQAIAEKDVTSTIVTNCDFHFALYRIAQSTTLLRTIESLWLQSGPYFRVLVKRYFADEAGERREVNAHKALLDALAAHDAEAARRALADDINKAGDYFVSMPEQARNSKVAHLDDRRVLLGKKPASTKNRRRRLP
jgi:DNA-binding GntR family transcriptional regulator